MKRCLTIEEEIFINQFSQNIHSLEAMNEWFNSYEITGKKDIIHNLLNMVIQSHPTYEDIRESAFSIKKNTSSSAVKLLNRNKPFNKFGHEICNLPEKELQTGFNILLLTLSKADKRRKDNEIIDTCNHWWHKDLSDEKYLQKLKENSSS